MKRENMSANDRDMVHKNSAAKLCGLLVAALLAGGVSANPGIVNAYAAEVQGSEVGAHDTTEGNPVPTDDVQEGSGNESESADGQIPSDSETSKEPETPTLLPTVTPELSATPTPTLTSGEEGATEPVSPTKEPGKTDEVKPTKKPGKPDETEPTKKPGKPDETEPTKKPGKPDETEPTKKPGKPDETEPTKKPDDTEVTDTPSPTPTKKPNTAVPTGSNDERYQYLLGVDAEAFTIDEPPAGYENEAAAAKNMKTITVPVWKMTASGKKYSSSFELTIHKKLAKNVQQIFKEIYKLDIKFPIKVLKGFMYRKVGGVGLCKSRLMSIHSFGAAIDINPGDYDNDYFLGKGNDLRDKSNPYCIPDEVIAIFEKHGWFWGGNFEICSDTMHFQYFELGMLTYQGNSPFRKLKVKSGYMKGIEVYNLQQRLCELGFKVTVDGVYGNKTASAIKKYQKSRGLKATGEMDDKTWETIINETHYMSYVF